MSRRVLAQAVVLLLVIALYIVVVTRGRPADWLGL
jgi:hypothetical protein